MMTPTASKLDNQITEIIEPKKAKEQKLIVNTFNTEYKVVVTAAKKMGFRNTKFDPSLNAFPPNNRNIDVDVFWYDLAIQPEILYRTKYSKNERIRRPNIYREARM